MWVWNQSYLGLGSGDGVGGDISGDFALGAAVWAPELGTDREFFCSSESVRKLKIFKDYCDIWEGIERIELIKWQ